MRNKVTDIYHSGKSYKAILSLVIHSENPYPQTEETLNSDESSQEGSIDDICSDLLWLVRGLNLLDLTSVKSVKRGSEPQFM